MQAMEECPPNLGSPALIGIEADPRKQRHLRLVVCRLIRCLYQEAGPLADLLSVGKPVYVGP